MSSGLIHLNPLETTNTDLAAALCAVGIPLRKDVPVRLMAGTGKGDSHCFFFQEKSPCGQYVTADLIKAWSDKEWHLRNPEHAFAYLKVAFENRARLMDYVKSGTRIATVQKGSKFGFLSLNASDDAQKRFFDELKRY